ncbi:hypothetical protein [Actinomadura madurae]|uniref:hypothetical protein n=1 Tax=Actinomadura madurae TaxID=1993 RepID=UPI0020D24C8F|nr:hypothetical protein [Actinomadura madurae]MCP9971202.1 hypothetical protein [Actinomadura madurae]MCQ0004745.1 hypothetical protein [Actinomadura madurae]MCQ0019927.1 hypothetical protein [Actinomadura madurae]
MKRTILVATALVVTAGGAGVAVSASADTGPAGAAKGIAWGKCEVSGPDDPMNQAECAQVEVPSTTPGPAGARSPSRCRASSTPTRRTTRASCS